MTSSVHVIAEMACSHEGDPELARRIVDGAGSGGADAIQFQIWKLDETMVPQHSGYEAGAKLELSQAVWRDLATYARERHPEMKIIACVYEEASVDFCEDIGVDAYKVHSADLSNPYLLSYVSKTNRRIDLSVGASTLDEIQRALDAIRKASSAEVWMMYGYQNFPTNPDDVHLAYLGKLKHLFEVPIGYQDHSDAETREAFWLPAAAVGLGVDVLEKHITHDRSYKGIDHQAALNPDEFKTFVTMVRSLEAAMGLGTPREFSLEEEKYRRYAKKSIVTRVPIAAGTELALEHIAFMRAETLGAPPEGARRWLGRKAANALPAFHLLEERDLL